MNMNRRLLYLIIFVAVACVASAQGSRQPVIAVVADDATCRAAGRDIDHYMQSINRSGKRTTLIRDVWGHPDSIRVRLKTLYLTDHLEGAVFIGDIPVVMIRDAQHLTSAFKMNQSRDRQESSVPSDRFYDDFDLQFDYIGRDSTRQAYHYYSLTAHSTHYIASDIYSARIKPPVVPGKDKYELISDYLQKVVKEKQAQRALSRLLYFAGHGYNSESYSARIDEGWLLRQQFPVLATQPGALDFINFDRDHSVKHRLMAALADPELDVAILHHHGADDTQYLSATPTTSAAQQYIDYTKKFLRSKLRNAKDTTATKKNYMETYNVPESWFANTFDAATIAADSLFDASLDISIPDLYGRAFHARFIHFDACFNGSFHLDDYISGHYVFNPGTTIAVKANTVNILQDAVPNELIGLLGEGVCIGNWAKHVFTLESHLIGDPTFCFALPKGHTHVDRNIVKEKDNPKYWRKLLGAATLPDAKALALVMLAKNSAISSRELLDILTQDPSPAVRLEAFLLLRKRPGPELTQAMILAMNDPYEMLQRQGALTAGKSGDPALLPTLAHLFFNPATSDRVIFQLRYALEQYPPETIETLFAGWREEHPHWPTAEAYKAYLDGLKRSGDSRKDDFGKLNSSDVANKNKQFTLSAQRNLCQSIYLDEIFALLKDRSADSQLRLLTAETLGWYVYSYKKAEIIGLCKALLATEQDEAVKNELQKTINRLSL
jgi:hypothetical protein